MTHPSDALFVEMCRWMPDVRDADDATCLIHPSDDGHDGWRIGWGSYEVLAVKFGRRQDAAKALKALHSEGVRTGGELRDLIKRVGIREVWRIMTECLAW